MAEGKILIIRTKHNEQAPYFCMSSAAVQDESLSWEARGVLAYLLSKPPDWKVLVSDLKQKCGKERVYRILKELEDAHYLRKEQRRRPDMTFEPIEYRVYESPSLYEPLPEKPETEKPEAGFPETANPLPEKPEALLSIEKPSNDSNKVKREQKRARKPDPVFTTIAHETFCIDGKITDPKTRGRINALCKVARTNFQDVFDSAPDDKVTNAIVEFYRDCLKQNIVKPTVAETFGTRFRAFLEMKAKVHAARLKIIPPPAPLENTGDLVTIEQMLADLKTLKGA